MTAARAIDVAQHLLITRRKFHDLVAEEVLPRREADGWNLDACRRAYLAHLRQQAAATAKTHALSRERAQLARAQAEAIEMKVASLRAQLVPAADVAIATAALRALAAKKLLSLVEPMAAAVAGMTKASSIRETLTGFIHTALHELASTEIAATQEAKCRSAS